LKIGVFFAGTGSFGLKFQVQWVVPTNHSFRRKTMMIDLSYGIKIWAEISFVLTDGRTDMFLIEIPLSIVCSAVKIEAKVVVSECTICYRVVAY